MYLGESNMWQGNNKQHIISDERMNEIDRRRIAKGLRPLWSEKQGESI